jgi:enoyl-CoA hydratase/carnithine racemase
VTWQHVRYRAVGGVGHVVLDRPEKLNALGIGPGSNRVELVEAIEHADADGTVGAILVSANGRAFCAGGDMTGVPRMRAPLDHRLFIEELDALHGRIRAVHKPTIAAVHGMCLGSGTGLIAQFDLVIAAEGTRFGLIEGRIGHPGATEIVPLIGAQWAKYLMLTGEIIDARRAASIGLVLAVEAPEALLDRCLDLAGRLARMPREAALLNKACIAAMDEAMGRAVGRSVGRTYDVLTRSMSYAATAPDGRYFEDILRDEGVGGMKTARDAQYGTPWLRPVDEPTGS